MMSSRISLVYSKNYPPSLLLCGLISDNFPNEPIKFLMTSLWTNQSALYRIIWRPSLTRFKTNVTSNTIFFIWRQHERKHYNYAPSYDYKVTLVRGVITRFCCRHWSWNKVRPSVNDRQNFYFVSSIKYVPVRSAVLSSQDILSHDISSQPNRHKVLFLPCFLLRNNRSSLFPCFP